MGKGIQGHALATLRSFAIDLAMAARTRTMGRAISRVEDKSTDGIYDPVTEADRDAEQAMRALISAHFPGHGITGEEHADKEGTDVFTWSLDPIDGTRSYICGLPTWTTLIALLEEGAPVLGVIDAPMLGETYVGSPDGATLINSDVQVPITTSGCRGIAQARFSTTDPFLFGLARARVEKIIQAARVTRFGHDGYAYARLAAGTIDLVIERGLKPHDYHALLPVIRNAGGHVGDWNGGSDFAPGDVIAAASRELYEEAVALLADE